MSKTTTPIATATAAKATAKKRRQNDDDARLIKLGRERDLSTAPAWIGFPGLSGVDLTQTQTFPVDKKARPRKRRWGEDWRELVIGASPYNKNVAPIPEQPVITVQEVVARKMLKLRTKLGITTDDLLPVSAAFESEKEFQPQEQRRSGRGHGSRSGQDEANVDDGSGRARLVTAKGGRCETATPATPDIGRWKKEADDMLSLLGTNADKCVHDYPMSELRRKMASSPPANTTEQHQHRQGHQRHSSTQEPLLLSNSSSASISLRPTGGSRGGSRRAVTEQSTDQSGQGRDTCYRMPQYRHDTPWPRPRPSAEAAAKARVGRRARAERGASTAADARAEIEEKVSTSLLGVVPEEFCRDAPPAVEPSSSSSSLKSATVAVGARASNSAEDAADGAGSGRRPIKIAVDSSATTGSRDVSPSLAAPAATGGGECAVAGAAHQSGLPTKASRPPRSDQQQQHASRPKRQRGATATATASGDGKGSNGERSRRRLAAFLGGQASATRAAAAGTARQGSGSPNSPSRAVTTVAGGRGGRSDGGAVGGGGRAEQGQPCDGSTSAVTAGRKDQTFFGLGGDTLEPTPPSESMTANFVGLLEGSLGLGVWTDPVASQLARPLNAVLAYLPPEGARLFDESGRRFTPPGGSHEAEANTPPDSEPSAAHATSPDGKKKKKTATATTTTTSGIKAAPTGAGRDLTKQGAACISAPGTAASSLLTVTMEHGTAEEAPRAVWLGRVAAVMEARGDRDEAVRLYGEAAAELTGKREGASRNGSRDGSGGTGSSCPSAAGKGRSAQLGGGDGGVGARAGPDLFPYSARAHYLASMIERSYRRHFIRRTAAQTLAAAAFRGYLARVGARKDQTHLSSAATFVARAWRRRMYRLGLATVKFQAVMRGAHGRRKARETRILIRHTISAQSVVRMFLAKRTAQRMRLEEASAGRLQALQRGFILRRVRATAISEIHTSLWRAALGLNRVARGFLHRRFAGMVRQFAVDGEITRSEAEAAAVGGAVRLTTTRVDMYLTTDAGKAELAQEMRRAKAAAVRTKILMRDASPEERRRASAHDVFDSFDLDGSGTIDHTELKALLGALGVAITDAELKVTSAAVDADGSGEISFSEFYAWFGEGGFHGGGDYGGGDAIGFRGMTSDTSENWSRRSSRSLSTARSGKDESTAALTSGYRSAEGNGRLRHTARATFVKARRNLRAATGMALQDRARRSVIRRWVSSAGREAQVRFREARPPTLECCACHQAFALYGDYWRHFGGGSFAHGAGLTCGKELEGTPERRKTEQQPHHHHNHHHHHHQQKQRLQRGRLFLDPTAAVGEKQHRRRGAERQWARLLDERRRLVAAGLRAEAAEEARIARKGSAGAHEHVALGARLLAALSSDLQRGGGKSGSSDKEAVPTAEEARATVARLAFQAFDRDGNGVLDVSDLADLLGVLRQIARRPPSARTAAGSSAAAAGYGLEAAMVAMDEDHSGQVDIDEFMRWFNGYDAHDGAIRSTAPGELPQRARESEEPLYVKVLGVRNGATGRTNAQEGREASQEEDADDGGSGSNSSGGGGDSSSLSSVAASTADRDDAVGARMSGDLKSAKNEKRPAAGGVFRVQAWFKRKAPATTNGSQRKKTKRKRRDQKEEEPEEDASKPTDDGDSERGQSGAKKRRRPIVGSSNTGDGSLASPSSANRSVAETRARGAPFSPRRLLGDRWSSSTADPWKRHAKTLRAVAEQEARTLLLRRARLRAQVHELTRFRATRPLEYDEWSSPDFLEKHGHTVAEITADADAIFVETLHQNLREAEEAVQHGLLKERSAPSPLPPPDPGISTATATATATTTTAAAAAALRSDGSGNLETGVDGGSAGALASAPSHFARSLGGRKWWGRRGGGRGTGIQVHAPGTWGERQPTADIAETIKAAERGAAAARRRAFQTPTGRAEIARAVRRLKANRVIAATSNTVAAAAEANGEAPQTNTAQGTHEERHTAATQVAAAGAENGGATWGAPANAGLSEDAGAKHTASVAKISTSNDVAGAVDRVAEREKRSPLVEQAELLFQLFDADGSGAIDRGELAPLLGQLGIWVTPKMASELFPRLDLDCSGDIRHEELVTWLENEGANLRRSPLSKMLRAGQSVKAGGSSTRRLESQVRASIVGRSRAAARAEVWASSGVTPPPAAAPAKVATTASAAAIDEPQEQAKQEDPRPQKQEQHHFRGEEEKKVVDEEAVVVEAATARKEPALGLEVTGGKERGRILATRAAGRRRRFEEEERDAEWELVVKRAEDVAERRIKRQWRTQAGAAELKRERDRMRGAEEALKLTLRAWDAGVSVAKEEAGVTRTDASALRETKRAEEKLRHMFRLFDVSCDGCIDAEELGRLLSRMNVPMSEAEIVGLLHEMDRDGSGDVDFCEFSAWWHKDGLKRSKRPAALIRSAASSLVTKVAPITAARRDARRALISRARAEARAEVKNVLRLEDEDEAALRLAKIATGNTAGAVAADAAGECFVAFETRVGREDGGTNSAPPGKPLLKGGTEGLGREGCGVGEGGEGRGDRLNAKRLAAARSSKLARAEAEAYADVQAMILTQAGKRELARRTRDLRLEWSAAIRTATRIARESGSGELGTAGLADYSNKGASHDKEEQRTQRKEQRQHATTTDTSGIPLVEAPILRFLWGLHGSTAAGATLETAGASAGVEPSELKYVGASLRSTLVGGANRRIWGSQATLLGSTLAKGTTGRTANIVRTSADFGLPPQAKEEATSPNAARTAGVESGEALSLSKIFDDHADDEIRDLKTLTRVDLADVLASLHRPSPSTLANSAGSAAEGERRPRTKAQIRADLATIAKLKLKLFFMPGAFRKLAKQAMLAEGRAFERHELARAIALEDGEPWRLAEAAETKGGIESSGGATPADVDRLRATTMGAAKLGRALAQGEELAAVECRSFLKTSAGREEFRATTAAVRDRRRQQQQHTAARTAAAVDPWRKPMVGEKTIRRIASAMNNLARDELRRAFALCEANGVPGEISRAEAAHVLSFAGIPQTTLAATGRVRVPLQEESKDSGGQPSQTPESQRRRRRQRRWPWRGRHAQGPSGSRPPPGRQGTPPPRLPWNTASRFLKIGGGAGPGGAEKQGNTGTGGNARVCPTNEDDGDDNAVVVGPIVVGPVSPPSQAGEKEDRGDDLDGDGGDACIGGEEDDGRGSDDHGSDGQFSVDMDMVDDVTNDEGFELGEMEILLAAVKARQTLVAKAASLGRLLARRALPTSLTDTRDAHMLLMSRARSAGRDKAMHKFENLLTVGTGDLSAAATHHHE